MFGNHGPREFELHPCDNHWNVKSACGSLGTSKLKRQAGKSRDKYSQHKNELFLKFGKHTLWKIIKNGNLSQVNFYHKETLDDLKTCEDVTQPAGRGLCTNVDGTVNTTLPCWSSTHTLLRVAKGKSWSSFVYKCWQILPITLVINQFPRVMTNLRPVNQRGKESNHRHHGSQFAFCMTIAASSRFCSH